MNPLAQDFELDAALPLPERRGRATSARGHSRLRGMLGGLSDVENIISLLPPQYQSVLTLRFGLRDGQSRTQAEVATHLGVSTATVGRLERAAIARLREMRPAQKE